MSITNLEKETKILSEETRKLMASMSLLIKTKSDKYKLNKGGKKRNNIAKSTATQNKTSASINPAITVIPSIAHNAQVTNTRLTGEITSHKADIAQTHIHTKEIRAAQNKARTEIAARCIKYKNNSIPQRGGFVVENAAAESLNIDATIKKSPVRAVVPDSNKAGSPDIVVTDGTGKKIKVSSKYYKTALESAKAQTDPRLNEQIKIIPQDQLSDGKITLENRARRETLRGRPDAAAQQRKTVDTLTDHIVVDSAKSTPMTRKNAHDLAKSLTVDRNGEKVVDMKKIDKVLDEVGVTAKVDKAVKKNDERIQKRTGDIVKTQKARVCAEIKGAAAAAGIAAVTTTATTVATLLIQNGVSVDNLQNVAVIGAQAGAESGLTALGAYGLARTTGSALCNAATTALTNAGVNITANIAAGVGIGVMGAVTTVAFSAYTFVKMKKQGATTREAFVAIGKNAAASLGITAVAGLTTLAFGAAAGVVASAIIGLGMIGFSLFKAFRNRRKEKTQNTFYSERGTPCFV